MRKRRVRGDPLKPAARPPRNDNARGVAIITADSASVPPSSTGANLATCPVCFATALGKANIAPASIDTPAIETPSDPSVPPNSSSKGFRRNLGDGPEGGSTGSSSPARFECSAWPPLFPVSLRHDDGRCEKSLASLSFFSAGSLRARFPARHFPWGSPNRQDPHRLTRWEQSALLLSEGLILLSSFAVARGEREEIPKRKAPVRFQLLAGQVAPVRGCS